MSSSSPSSSSSPPRSCLLTVGSTSFTPLVQSFLSRSTLTVLHELGYERVIAQIGTSSIPLGFEEGHHAMPMSLKKDGEARTMELFVMRFDAELEAKVGHAELVISHAGAGSILSFLRPISEDRRRRRPRRLILVPNSSLMDSHQSDLADEFEENRWAWIVREPSDLVDVLRKMRDQEDETNEVNPFPPFEPQKIRNVLDQVMGYV